VCGDGARRQADASGLQRQAGEGREEEVSQVRGTNPDLYTNYTKRKPAKKKGK